MSSTAYAMPLTSPTYPAAGARELWGFSEKLAQPALKTEIDTPADTLHYGPRQIAVGTISYQYKQADPAAVGASLAEANFDLTLGLGKVVQDYLA